MSWNKNSGYGQAMLNMVASQVPAFGNILVVFDPDDTDEKNFQHWQEIMSPDNDGQIRFYTSLETAYAAAESDNNDIILLDGNSTHIIADGIAWSKNRIHVFGMDGGDRLVQQGAKVQNTAGVGTAYVIKVTGVRNSFRNIKFIQADTDAAALHVLEEGGEGNLYKNCTFTFGVVDNLDLTTATEVLAGSDSATFIKCLFGTETLLTSAARTVFTIDQVTTSQEFKSNILEDCTFLISSSSASSLFISMAAAGDILFTNLFIRPIFMASVDSAGGVALTKGVTTANGTVKGTLNLYAPAAFNVSNLGVNGTNNDALQVYGAANTGTDYIGMAPVAT